MLETEISRLIKGVNDALGGMIALEYHHPKNTPVGPELLEQFTAPIEAIKDFAARLQLKATAGRCENMLAVIGRGRSSVFNIHQDVQQLVRDLIIETRGVSLLWLDPFEPDADNQPVNLWTAEPEEFFGPLPKCIYASCAADLREAMRCFAIERYTACVLHCSRALEAVISEIIFPAAGSPQLRDPNMPTWGDYSAAIKKHAEAQRKSGAWQGDRVRYFLQVVGDYDKVKDAERTLVCHTGVMFDTGRARTILHHVSTLLRHAATHLGDQGSYSP